MEWAQIHIEAVKKNCIKQIQFNQPIPQDILAEINVPIDDESDTYQNDTTGESATFLRKTSSGQQTFIFTPDLLTQIKEVSCINDCYGHGKCIKGIYFSAELVRIRSATAYLQEKN